MAHIFLSYANADLKRAKVLAEAIEKHGWSVWWDRKIPLGKSWDQVIEEQVDAARCIIVLWSSDSISSTWVKAEAREGKERGVLIPVLIDDVKIPLEFRHMQSARLTNWQADAPSSDFQMLLAHIAEMLGPGRQETTSVAGAPTPAPAPGRESIERGRPARATSASVEPNLVQTLGGPAPALCLQFLPDGERLVSLWGDRCVRIWRLVDGKLLETLHGEGHSAWHVDRGANFSLDGTLLATTPDHLTVLLWRVSDGRLLQTLRGHTDVINAVAFSPGGSIIASASDDKTVRLWNTTDGTVVRTLSGNTQWVHRLAFSPDGELLATGGQVFISAPELKLWRVSDGTALGGVAGHSGTIFCLAFSPDGTMLASGSNDSAARTWHVADCTPRHTLASHGNTVSSVAFSPDGRVLASGSHDTTIRLWSSESGEQMHRLEGHGALVTCIAFSMDGNVLASGSLDHTVRLWSLEGPEPGAPQ